MDQNTLHLIVLLLSVSLFSLCCIVGSTRRDVDMLIDELEDLINNLNEGKDETKES